MTHYTPTRDTIKFMETFTKEEILQKLPLEKQKALYNAINRNFMLTSEDNLYNTYLNVYKEGYYLHCSGTRCEFSCYLKDNDGELTFTRKPAEKTLNLLYTIGLWNGVNSINYNQFCKEYAEIARQERKNRRIGK